MNKLTTQPVKGFRDLYPEDFAVQNWLFSIFNNVAKSYGYKQYDGPMLESFDLYASKSGEELVNEQTFKLEDRGGRKLALRPELTPTLSRMVAKKRFELPIPIRWFSIGSRFRYEAPQKGRAREFYQMDADLLGVPSPFADAEIISIAIDFLTKLGFGKDDFVVKVNSRMIMEKQLSEMNIDKQKYSNVIRAIDRKDKMPENKWMDYLKDIGLSNDQVNKLASALKDKSAEKPDELSKLFSILADQGYGEFVEYDPTIVRGLDYYTGMVFEVRDREGKFRAILGGGRYDNLVELFDTEPLSGVGFACGNLVLTEFLKSKNKLPDQSKLNTQTTILVTLFSKETEDESLNIARELRKKNVSTELYPDTNTKLDKQLKYADKMSIPYAIIIGPDEVRDKNIVLKNLKDKKQEKIDSNDFLNNPSNFISS